MVSLKLENHGLQVVSSAIRRAICCSRVLGLSCCCGVGVEPVREVHEDQHEFSERLVSLVPYFSEQFTSITQS